MDEPKLTEKHALHLLKKIAELELDIDLKTELYSGAKVSEIIRDRFPELETHKKKISKVIDTRFYKKYRF